MCFPCRLSTQSCNTFLTNGNVYNIGYNTPPLSINLIHKQILPFGHTHIHKPHTYTTHTFTNHTHHTHTFSNHTPHTFTNHTHTHIHKPHTHITHIPYTHIHKPHTHHTHIFTNHTHTTHTYSQTTHTHIHKPHTFIVLLLPSNHFDIWWYTLLALYSQNDDLGGRGKDSMMTFSNGMSMFRMKVVLLMGTKIDISGILHHMIAGLCSL